MKTPLVTVLTPVHNGAATIARCVESVLAQTHERWEYVIVDNASTDGTGEIVARYAAREPRLRVYTSHRFVRIIANHNIALRHIAPDSVWCKFVHADDELLPECLEQMLRLAGTYPSVGLVSAYRLRGRWVDLDGLPYPVPVIPGPLICRWTLLGFPSVFGSPTSHMIRSDLVRGHDPFYDESTLHADEGACYEILRDSDLGFVYQVLSSSPLRPDGLSLSVAQRLNTFLLGRLKVLKAYGRVYLTPEEYEKALSDLMNDYYRFLAAAYVVPGRADIRRFHRRALRALGVPISAPALARALVQRIGEVLLSPRSELSRLARAYRGPVLDENEGCRTTDLSTLLPKARRDLYATWSSRADGAWRREVDSFGAGARGSPVRGG